MKMLNIKSLLVVLVTIFASLVMNAAVAEEHVWKVSDDVYRYGNPNVGYFSMFVVTDKGVIVIDPMNNEHSKGMLKAIKKVTNKPVRYLLHSHNHWDHSKGGKIFRDQGVQIVAHAEAVEWMKDNPHPDLVLPDQVWTGVQKNIVLGNKTIELHYYGYESWIGHDGVLAS